MNDHWGYNKNDHNWKTANQLIWNLVDVVAKGGNYLLNVGPTGEGLFPDASIHRLREIGDWMKINKEAIYDIKTWDYFQEGDKIRYARNANGDVFVYSNGWPGNELMIKKIKPTAGSAIQNCWEAKKNYPGSKRLKVLLYPYLLLCRMKQAGHQNMYMFLK